MSNIGKNIRAARVRRDMTQDDLAERLHVSRQTVSNYETGRSRPDVEMLLAAAKELEVDVQVLLYGEPLRPERRREICILAAAGAALAILGAGLLRLEGWVRRFQGRFYVLGPGYLLRCLAVPAFWLLAGWLLLRACGIFLGVKPLPPRKARPLRRAALACLAIWAVLEGPAVVEAVREILYVLGREPGAESSYSGGVRLPAIWERASVWGLYWLGTRFPAVFALPGGALWLSGGGPGESASEQP